MPIPESKMASEPSHWYVTDANVPKYYSAIYHWQNLNQLKKSEDWAFDQTTGFHGNDYYHQCHPIFLTSLINFPNLIKQSNHWLVRDGRVLFSNFFNKFPIPPKNFNSQLIVPREFQNFIPKNWSESASFSFYDKVFKKTKTPWLHQSKNSKLLITFSLNRMFCDENQIKQFLSEYIKNKHDTKYEKVVICPIYSTNAYPSDDDESLMLEHLKLFFNKFGAEVSHYKFISQSENLLDWDVAFLDNRLMVFDSSFENQLISKGANQIFPKPNYLDDKKNSNFFPLSNYHGFLIQNSSIENNKSSDLEIRFSPDPYADYHESQPLHWSKSFFSHVKVLDEHGYQKVLPQRDLPQLKLTKDLHCFKEILGKDSIEIYGTVRSIFLNTYRDSLNRFPVDGQFLVRDGAIPLLWFFMKNKKPPQKFNCLFYLPRILLPLVPKEWLSNFKGINAASSSNFPTKNKKLIVHGGLNDSFTSISSMNHLMEQMSDLISKSDYEEIYIHMPVTNNPKWSAQSETNQFEFISNVLQMGTKPNKIEVNSLQWKNLVDIKDMKSFDSIFFHDRSMCGIGFVEKLIESRGGNSIEFHGEKSSSKGNPWSGLNPRRNLSSPAEFLSQLSSKKESDILPHRPVEKRQPHEMGFSWPWWFHEEAQFYWSTYINTIK